jgi:hypothetical protein
METTTSHTGQPEQVLTSVYKGSEKTYEMVAEQIAERWGEDAAAEYDPEKNCFTYNRWKQEGYFVKKGEKSLESVTWIVTEKKNEQTGETEKKRYPKKVCLFFIKQVEKIQN